MNTSEVHYGDINTGKVIANITMERTINTMGKHPRQKGEQ